MFLTGKWRESAKEYLFLIKPFFALLEILECALCCRLKHKPPAAFYAGALLQQLTRCALISSRAVEMNKGWLVQLVRLEQVVLAALNVE